MDEFGAFLSEVQASVTEQVDRWRRRIEEAVRRWSAEGLRTRRLEALLAEDAPVDPDPVLEDYEARVRELRGIAEQIGELAPDLAGAEVFRDPDQIATARELLDRARAGGGPLTAPLPRYRLEDYAEGTANRIALEAVRQIVAGASPAAPVLLIVGSAGSGKTHLLHGAGNALVAKGAGPVACLSAHAFAAEVAGLAGAEPLESWRQRYRWVGSLLLDDLQLLARESAAQEELVRLMDELREGGRPLLCTATAPPESLPGLERRLVERLREAPVVPLRPPDREIRLAVAKRRLAGTAAAQDAGLADYFAGRPAESVRSLLAAVDRLLAEAEAQDVTPSAALAREVLDLSEPAAPVPAVRSGSVRGSGILSPGVGLVKSREKMVDAWPRVADYLITEFR